MESLIDSLLISGGLLYKALWPILFGVLLTALIETLVDRDRMAALLGGHDLKTVGRASLAGTASSACTFGALSITMRFCLDACSVPSTGRKRLPLGYPIDRFL